MAHDCTRVCACARSQTYVDACVVHWRAPDRHVVWHVTQPAGSIQYVRSAPVAVVSGVVWSGNMAYMDIDVGISG